MTFIYWTGQWRFIMCGEKHVIGYSNSSLGLIIHIAKCSVSEEVNTSLFLSEGEGSIPSRNAYRGVEQWSARRAHNP